MNDIFLFLHIAVVVVRNMGNGVVVYKNNIEENL